jgi:hypothetical protein
MFAINQWHSRTSHENCILNYATIITSNLTYAVCTTTNPSQPNNHTNVLKTNPRWWLPVLIISVIADDKGSHKHLLLVYSSHDWLLQKISIYLISVKASSLKPNSRCTQVVSGILTYQIHIPTVCVLVWQVPQIAANSLLIRLAQCRKHLNLTASCAVMCNAGCTYTWARAHITTTEKFSMNL